MKQQFFVLCFVFGIKTGLREPELVDVGGMSETRSTRIKTRESAQGGNKCDCDCVCGDKPTAVSEYQELCYRQPANNK